MVDFSVLVDVISNAAGMMIIFACIAMLIEANPVTEDPQGKPIGFPLAYMPIEKMSVALVLKNNRLYQLPTEDLLKAVLAENRKGKTVGALNLQKNGVSAGIRFAKSGLGYRFLYNIDKTGGIPLKDTAKIRKELDRLLDKYPPSMYFLTIHTWPEDFSSFRDIREYLNEKGMVVGWNPRTDDNPQFGQWHIVMAVGEYSNDFSTIKAQ